MEFHSTEQSIAWFRDRYRDGEMTIRPPFQRNPVWAQRQRSSLIESILLKLPVPEVFIQEQVSEDGATSFAVVDGQQRIRTILQFLGADQDDSQLEFNGFALDQIPPESPWYGVRFDDLDDSTRRAFFGYKLSIRFLETDSDDEIRDMFKRLNKYLTPLNAQEMRNALYRGPFMVLSVELAEDDFWSDARVVGPASIRRMADVQLVSELLIGLMHGPQGGAPSLVDEYYAQYEDFETEFPGQRRTKRQFDETLTLLRQAVPDIRDSRWSNVSDFYSLFLAAGSLLEESSSVDVEALRGELSDFAAAVDRKLRDPDQRVTTDVRDYSAAVQRGANDKARRAARHGALRRALAPHFSR